MELSPGFIRSINAYLGNRTEEEIKKCVAKTSILSNTPISDVIKQLRNSFLTIHLYVEDIDSDTELFFKLSRELKEFCNDIGWPITGYVGTGGGADVFLVKGIFHGDAALILISNADNLQNIQKYDKLCTDLMELQKTETMIGDTFVKIYKIVYFGAPYSDDKIYIKYSYPNFKNRPVLIQEYAPYTADTYLRHIKSNNSDLLLFNDRFTTKYNKMLRIITDASYTYTDLKGENIGLFPRSSIPNTDFDLKFIDIETFRKVTKEEAEKWFERVKIQYGEYIEDRIDFTL